MTRRQLPRATAAQLNAATFLAGEIAVDTTNDELRYDGDGATVGGIAVARKDGSNLNASSSLVTGAGGTTALTLANLFGTSYGFITVEAFGADPTGVANSSTAIQAALDSGAKRVFAFGTYLLNTMITIPKGVALIAPGAVFKPGANVDMIRLHGGAKLLNYPKIDVTSLGSWSSACILFDGSSESSSTTLFRIPDPTICEVECRGDVTGTGNGTAIYFKTVDDTINNQWIMGVWCRAKVQGFDKALYMVKDGTDLNRTFVNANHIWLDCGSSFQSIVMESDAVGSYGVDGNKIYYEAQTRSSAAEHTAAAVVLAGQYNHLIGDQIDWVGGNTGTVPALTIASGARQNYIVGIYDPAFVSNSSTELSNIFVNTYHTNAGLYVGYLRAIDATAIQFGNTLRPAANDGAALGTPTASFSDAYFAAGAVFGWNNGDVTLTHSADALTGAGGQLLWTLGAGNTTAPAKFTNTTDAATVVALTVEGDRATVTNADAVAIGFNLSDASGNQDNMGRVICLLSDATNASEDAQFRFSMMVAGTLTSVIDMTATNLRPVTNDAVALGGATISFSDLFLASGGVINFNNGDVTLTHSANLLAFAGASTGYTFDALTSSTASLAAHTGTAIPAGGTAGAGLLVSSTSNFGVFFGSGAPTLVAAKGSLYLRSDGSSTSTRMYVATDSAGAWTAVTTAT